METPKNHEKPWTSSETLKLKTLKTSKKTSNEIAQMMGRTQEAILSKKKDENSIT